MPCSIRWVLHCGLVHSTARWEIIDQECAMLDGSKGYGRFSFECMSVFKPVVIIEKSSCGNIQLGIL